MSPDCKFCHLGTSDGGEISYNAIIDAVARTSTWLDMKHSSGDYFIFIPKHVSLRGGGVLQVIFWRGGGVFSCRRQLLQTGFL